MATRATKRKRISNRRRSDLRESRLHSVELREIHFGEDNPNIDEEKGVIRNVKIIGLKSANGRDYSPKALRESISMYEGMDVFIDHPPRDNPGMERSVRDSWGFFSGVHFRESDSPGLYGDLNYLKEHPDTTWLLERARRMPNKIGMSHNAKGSARRGIVESIDKVRSVDLVVRPATTKGLFESKEDNMENEITLEELVEGLDEGSNDRKWIECLIEDEVVPADMPVDAAPELSPEEQVKAAFKSMVNAVLDEDEDTQSMITKIKDILKAKEKLMEKPKPKSKPPGDGGGGDGPPSDEKQESLIEAINELKEEVRSLKEGNADEQLLESAGVRVTDARIKFLGRCKTKAEKRELIESWPQDGTTDQEGLMDFVGIRPRRQPPKESSTVLTESRKDGKDGNGKAPAALAFKDNGNRLGFLRRG